MFPNLPEKLRRQHTNSKVVPHSGHRDSPLFVSLSPRVGPLSSVGVSMMAPKFQPENETEPGRRTPTRQGSSFNTRNYGSRRDFSPFCRSSILTYSPGHVPWQLKSTGRVACRNRSDLECRTTTRCLARGSRGRTNSVVVAGEGRDALRSTESEKRGWERGIWRIPHSL